MLIGIKKKFNRALYSPHNIVRESGFRNFPVEFGILGFGICNTLNSRNLDPANDWNPNKPIPLKKKSGIREAWNSQSKTVLVSILLPGGELYRSTLLHVRGGLNTLYLQVIGVLTYLCL